MKMETLIKFCDFYGTPVTLKINGDNIRYKTIFGGLISICTILVCLGLCGYFLSQFVMRTNPIIISNIEQSSEIKLDIYKVPYMLRITDSKQVVHPQKERYWGIRLYIWTSKFNESDPNINKVPVKSYFEVPMEVCDLEKHFGEYREYFEKYNDLSSFMCPNFKGFEENSTLLGKYGEIKPNSYYMYYVYYCIAGLNNKTNCENKDAVKNYLANSYLDVRTIDYQISTMQEEVRQRYIRNDRHAASSSVYKRIYQFIQSVRYSTDFGSLFNDTITEEFFQLDQVRYESDIRDLETGSTVNGTFVVLNILNTPSKINYYRSYMKLQTFIANVGGVINGIMQGAMILTYFFLLKLYDLQLVNGIMPELPIEEPLDAMKGDKIKAFMNMRNNNNFTQHGEISSKTNNYFIDPSLKQASTKERKDSVLSSVNFEFVYKLVRKRQNQMTMSFADLYFPKSCLKKKTNRNIYENGKSYIVEMLNIINILKRFSDFEKLKDILLNESQKRLFHLIPLKKEKFSTEDFTGENVIKTIEKSMMNKSKIDTKLVNCFKYYNGN